MRSWKTSIRKGNDCSNPNRVARYGYFCDGRTAFAAEIPDWRLGMAIWKKSATGLDFVHLCGSVTQTSVTIHSIMRISGIFQIL